MKPEETMVSTFITSTVDKKTMQNVMQEKQQTVKITTEFLRMTEECNSNFDRKTNGYKQIAVDINWMILTTPIVT